MTLKSWLMEGAALIPIEDIWEALDKDNQKKAFRMLEQGELSAQGRPLMMDTSPNQSGLGQVGAIAVEQWLDADEWLWAKNSESNGKFQLRGEDPEEVIVDINIKNSELLREFVGFESATISIDEYDVMFFKATGTKMSAKVWAQASAALASDRIDATSGKMADYLLAQSEIWPMGKLDRRNLMKHLSIFIKEFKRLDNTR